MNSGDIHWNQIAQLWKCEPELRHPIPRRVKPRIQAPKRGFGERFQGCLRNGCLNAILFFMLLTGLSIGYWMGLAILIEPFGVTATGRVTKHEMYGRTPYLGFAWRHNGVRYEGEAVAGEETFWRRQNNAPIQIRYFPFAPNLRPVLEESRLWWGFAALLAPVSLLLIGAGALPMLGFLPVRRRGKRLVARGAPVLAVVTRVGVDKSRKRQIEFLYRVNERVYESRTVFVDETLPAENEILTALVDPKKPERVILYRGADWVAS